MALFTHWLRNRNNK
ncbi:type I toxin-antitoxin system Fst family toxin [Staphylococcus aureus]|nr:type I toxin-antitoxin system Fst family toxin [Staphylococcus aureus]